MARMRVEAAQSLSHRCFEQRLREANEAREAQQVSLSLEMAKDSPKRPATTVYERAIEEYVVRLTQAERRELEYYRSLSY